MRKFFAGYKNQILNRLAKKRCSQNGHDMDDRSILFTNLTVDTPQANTL